MIRLLVHVDNNTNNQNNPAEKHYHKQMISEIFVILISAMPMD